MAKIATSKKPRELKKRSLKAHIPFKSNDLKNVDLVIEILLNCIKVGDNETFREVLISHLVTVNKVKFALKANLGRRTLYDLMDPNKEFNPELTTISALIRAIAA